MLIVTFERGLSWPPLIIKDAGHLDAALSAFNGSTLLGVPLDKKYTYATQQEARPQTKRYHKFADGLFFPDVLNNYTI